VITTENYRKLPKSTENFPKTKLSKTNPNPHHNPNPNLNPKSNPDPNPNSKP